ncbi:MAG TPA: hypothetical protein PK435_13235, partial [Thermoanaerobaculaceae bacterium]|nr:hypothetical protein [Thermoanaerobaculaceae bacterium]
PIRWPRFKSANFDAYDVPGRKEWLGFTPFDDEGIDGRPVKLLDGVTGDQNLLGASSGNLRAAGFSWHPIVRQRCLQVRALAPAPPPEGACVLIDDISEGSFDGKTVELRSSRQCCRDRFGRSRRLRPIHLRFRPESVIRFRAFGDNAVRHPGGGCHKGLQRGLEITFDCPSAWCRPSDAWLELEMQDGE